MLIKRVILFFVILSITGCNRVERTVINRLTIGVVSYENSDRSLAKYSQLRDYLAVELNSIIELEPVYNEIQASNRIANQQWDLVFAPPGLAAIAIYRHRYIPVVPLEGIDNNRSVIVVRRDSAYKDLKDLAGEVIALGQVGSATKYYLPIYNLYGLAFKEVRFAPTAKTGMQWLESGTVAATALSLAEYNRHRQELGANKFRILHTDYHKIPSGAIAVGEKVERNQQEQIKRVLTAAPSHIAASAQFLPNAPLPNYDYLIKAIERVEPIAVKIKEKPARLYKQK